MCTVGVPRELYPAAHLSLPRGSFPGALEEANMVCFLACFLVPPPPEKVQKEAEGLFFYHSPRWERFLSKDWMTGGHHHHNEVQSLSPTSASEPKPQPGAVLGEEEVWY